MSKIVDWLKSFFCGSNPKVRSVMDQIQHVVEIASPIVAEVAKQNLTNNAKFAEAIAKTAVLLANPTKENIVTTGVQLAYSLFKASQGK